MEPLTWHFDWATRRAVANAIHGTCTIVGEGSHDWSARFIRPVAAGGQPGVAVAHYHRMADAVHAACHAHAESYAQRVGYPRTITPLPEE